MVSGNVFGRATLAVVLGSVGPWPDVGGRIWTSGCSVDAVDGITGVGAVGAVGATATLGERVSRARIAASATSVSPSTARPTIPKSTRGARPVAGGGSLERQRGQNPDTGCVT